MENTYQKLLEAVEGLPEEAVERASKEVTRKGYDTTGYQYQFLVNVMNDVLGIGSWGFSYSVLRESEGHWQSGKGYWEITTDVEVWVKQGEEKASFHCAGGHRAELHADALKGAITNGLKKTLSFFGVGKKAYEGTIDEDYRPLPSSDTKTTPKAPYKSKSSVRSDSRPFENLEYTNEEDKTRGDESTKRTISSLVQMLAKKEKREIKTAQDISDWVAEKLNLDLEPEHFGAILTGLQKLHAKYNA